MDRLIGDLKCEVADSPAILSDMKQKTPFIKGREFLENPFLVLWQ
jgi:hypothetical protein